MYPELINIRGFSIKMYGFCLMVGFLTGVWLAMRRAARVKVDPDRVLDVSFLALIFGVAGARLFYVVHYWRSQFADAPNKFLAIVDIRAGGLEFLGGFLGATLAIVIYLLRKKQSLRLYLDILAPSAMWGLALGRIGCFLNGCCFGGICATSSPASQVYAWAMPFPFFSPPQQRQWEERRVTVPAELVISSKNDLIASPLPEYLISMSPERRQGPLRKAKDAAKAFERTKAADPNSPAGARLEVVAKAAEKAANAHVRELGLTQLHHAMAFPSRVQPSRQTSVSELQDLAAKASSLPIHPVQLYASIHAMLLSGLLSAIFYRRRRHGIVIGWLFVLYPVARVMEELIRADNPRDVAGLTISQSISLAMFVAGVVYLILVYKQMPLRSSYADAAKAKQSEEKEA